MPTRLKPNERLRKFLEAVEGNEWHPFVSEVEFEIAQFIVMNGIANRAANDLLKISAKGRTEKEFQLKNVHQLREKLKYIPKERWEVRKIPNPMDANSSLEFYFKDVWLSCSFTSALSPL